LLTGALPGGASIPNISKAFVVADLSVWKRDYLGVRTQPPGFRPDPTFSLANSPVSPVDRLRLLTGGGERGVPGAKSCQPQKQGFDRNFWAAKAPISNWPALPEMRIPPATQL
jgi:hypothetical protein